MFFVFLLVFYNRLTFSYINFIFFPFIFIIGILAYNNLSFLGDKISQQYEGVEHIMKVNIAKKSGDSKSFGRIGSAIMDIEDLMQSPFFGVGGNDNLIRYSLDDKNNFYFVNRTNGLTEFLLKFGIVGTLFFMFFLFKSFRIIIKQNRSKGTWFIFICFILSMFSNPILFTPFSILFVVYPLLYFELNQQKLGVNTD